MTDKPSIAELESMIAAGQNPTIKPDGSVTVEHPKIHDLETVLEQGESQEQYVGNFRIDVMPHKPTKVFERGEDGITRYLFASDHEENARRIVKALNARPSTGNADLAERITKILKTNQYKISWDEESALLKDCLAAMEVK